ncbi:MAG: type I glyceraldehyde-3-phosphate dehydrogenase [Campylobacterales bacterium]
MAIKVAINGAGRIGRACARMVLASPDMQLLAANDPMDPQTLDYLLRYDSVHGALDSLPPSLKFSSFLAPAECDFSGADVVLECSGRFLTREANRVHLKRGAKKVVLSAIPKDDTPVVAPGSQSVEPIVSAGSCTTNALWLLTVALQEAFGVETVLATSLHSYTSDQNLLDAKHTVEKRRGRAAALNIIPVETMAARNLARFESRWQTCAAAIGIRVPTPDVSLMQAVFRLGVCANKNAVNEALLQKSRQMPANLLAVENEPKVSGDMIGNPCSAVVAADLTQTAGSLVSVSAWHDNEWGYAARMIDLARLL